MPVTPRISNVLKYILQDRYYKLRQAQLLVPKLLYLVDQIFEKYIRNSTQGGPGLVFEFALTIALSLAVARDRRRRKYYSTCETSASRSTRRHMVM